MSGHPWGRIVRLVGHWRSATLARGTDFLRLRGSLCCGAIWPNEQDSSVCCLAARYARLWRHDRHRAGDHADPGWAGELCRGLAPILASPGLVPCVDKGKFILARSAAHRAPQVLVDGGRNRRCRRVRSAVESTRPVRRSRLGSFLQHQKAPFSFVLDLLCGSAVGFSAGVLPFGGLGEARLTSTRR